jgi:serine/threonine-protein kinase HipA
MPASKVPTLEVHWHTGDSVGEVVNPGSYAFGYTPEWLQRGASLSPLRVNFAAEIHRLRDPAFDHLPGFLADCLPDVWGRTVMQREFIAQGVEPNPMRMLAWVGNRGLGALQFRPALNFDADGGGWSFVRPVLLAREAQAVLRNEPAEAFVHLRAAGTAGGNFPKATVALLPDGGMLCGGNVAAALPSHPGARLGILKLDVEDNPTRPSTDGRLEKAYMEMARAAGLRVANCEVIIQPDETRVRHHLFVERFDVQDGGSRRLHLLSLAGALETFQGLAYPQLFRTTRALTAQRAQMLEAVRRMVFNVRAANADDHGKNHSFTFDRENNRWELSPAYDLTLNFSDVRSFNGLFPATFGNTPRRERMEEVALAYEVTDQEFAEIDERVAETISRWPEFAAANNVAQPDAERAAAEHARMSASLEGHIASKARRSRKRRW